MPPAEQRTGTPSTLCIEPRIIRPRASLPVSCVCQRSVRLMTNSPVTPCWPDTAAARAARSHETQTGLP